MIASAMSVQQVGVPSAGRPPTASVPESRRQLHVALESRPPGFAVARPRLAAVAVHATGVLAALVAMVALN